MNKKIKNIIKYIFYVGFSLYAAYYLSDAMISNTSVHVDLVTAIVLFVIIFIVSLLVIVFREYIFKMIRGILFIFLIVLGIFGGGGDDW